jgi:hypothetical protein
MSLIPFAPFSAVSVSSAVKIFRFRIFEIVLPCDGSFMSTRDSIQKEVDANASDENTGFNGAELSESVLGRDWNSPEEDAAWSNL